MTQLTETSLRIPAALLGAISQAGEAVIQLDEADGTLKVSIDGSPFVPLGGGGGGGGLTLGMLQRDGSGQTDGLPGLNVWTRLSLNQFNVVGNDPDLTIGGPDNNGMIYTGEGFATDYLLVSSINCDLGATCALLFNVGENRVPGTPLPIGGMTNQANNTAGTSALKAHIWTPNTGDYLEWFALQYFGPLTGIEVRWASAVAIRMSS